MNVLDLLFPKVCLNCSKNGKYICNNCISEIKPLNRFDRARQTYSIFSYSGVIKKAILKLKYKFAYDIAEELSSVSIKFFKNPFLNTPDVVLLPIPLHKSRQNWRGFNQSEVVGKILAKNFNWKFDNTLLIRTVKGKSQVGLLGIERARNIRGKFAVNPSLRNAISKNSTYLVFDDILTTGSTIQEAISVLRQSGVEKVFGLTIAR